MQSVDEPPERTVPGNVLSHVFTLDGEHAVSPVLQAPTKATRVGLALDVTDAAAGQPLRLEARGIDAQGRPGAWLPAQFTFVEHPYRVARVDLGDAFAAVQVRLPEAQVPLVSSITWSAVVPEEGRTREELERMDDTAPLAQALDADLAAAGVQPREAWGARPATCSALDEHKIRLAIHHTMTAETSNGTFEGRLRQIQAFHIDTRGWCDIGYHFLVTTDGRVWEGRPASVLGANVANNNSGTAGVSFVGCFQPGACGTANTEPPPRMLEGAGKLLQILVRRWQIAVTTDSLKGHRDFPGASTACPGDSLYAHLGELRSVASQPVAPPPPAEGKVEVAVWDRAVGTGASPFFAAAVVTTSTGSTLTVVPGTATVLTAAAGSWLLTTTADGYVPVQTNVEVLASQTIHVDVVLAPREVPVQVRVLDAQTRAPLAGAQVSVGGLGPFSTDAQGLATLAVQPGPVTVEASLPDFGLASTTATVLPNTPLSVELALVPKTGTIVGVVFDKSVTATGGAPGNRPLTAAHVTFAGGQTVAVRSPDAQYRLAVRPGTYTVTATAPGFDSASMSVTVRVGVDSWASIGLLPQSGYLEATVWDRTVGKGAAAWLPSATVTLSDGRTQTVVPGTTTRLAVRPGTLGVNTSAPGYALRFDGLTLTSGQTSRLDIVLTALDVEARVRVVGAATNAPLTGAAVSLDGRAAVTVSSVGAALFTVPPGSHALSVTRSGYVAATATFALNPNTPSEIVISMQRPSGTVQGVVWDAAVTSSPSAAGNRRVTTATITCSNGTSTRVRAGDAFWSMPVPPGTYRFTASAPGYTPAVRTMTVTSGATSWSSFGLRPGP